MKRLRPLIMPSLSVCALLVASLGQAEDIQKSAAETPAVPNFHPGEDRSDAVRMWQGISGLECTAGGRLWATWYGGGLTEDLHNYVMLVTSGDNGQTWSELKLVLDPDGDGPVRAFDPCPWIDPSGRLWLFWCQATKGGGRDPFTFAMTTENPNYENPKWSEPRLIHDGVMMCKPTIVTDGAWLLPTAIWGREKSCRVVASTDQGKTWQLRGEVGVRQANDRDCDEPMLVQRQDGSLWQLIRTKYGIGESVSQDGGKTWSETIPSNVAHTASRFFIRRLKSGNLLLVKHGPIAENTGRSKLTAFLSKDDGKTWQGGLMLDERSGVSYPDGAEGPNGVIYITYDFDRVGQKFIYMSTFTEEDILAGKGVSGQARNRVVINHATGTNPRLAAKSASSKLQYNANSDGHEFLAGSRPEVGMKNGTVAALEKGSTLFTDREYKLHELPDVLRGKQFVRGSMAGNVLTVQRDGILYVATPVGERNKDSLEDDLLKQGFTKVKLPEFLLFGETNAAGNVCTIYQKSVKVGDSLKLGKWGVAIF